MSEVSLRIGGRNYTVACADGEEDHVRVLGEVIDAKLQQLGGKPSAQESQNLLFAALLLADELDEARTDRDRAKSDRDSALADRQAALDEVAPLKEIAGKVERFEKLVTDADRALSENRSEIESLKGERDAANERAEKLFSENAELRQEASQIAAEKEALTTELAKRDAAPPPATPGLFDDPDLVPSLERFADLLENCATKLEGKAATS